MSSDSYAVGDRVQRLPCDVGKVPAGTLGTVTQVENTIIFVQWDLPGRDVDDYPLAICSLFFISIGTGQSTTPVLCCKRCGEYNEYAAVNMSDGTYSCYQCRYDKWR